MGTFSASLAMCAGNSPVNGEFPTWGQWRGALLFPLICAWINGWVYNRETGDSIRYRAHNDVTIMFMNAKTEHYILHRCQLLKSQRIACLRFVIWNTSIGSKGRTSDILVFGDPHYDRGHRAKVKYSYYIIHVYRCLSWHCCVHETIVYCPCGTLIPHFIVDCFADIVRFKTFAAIRSICIIWLRILKHIPLR